MVSLIQVWRRPGAGSGQKAGRGQVAEAGLLEDRPKEAEQVGLEEEMGNRPAE